jgi:ABC-type multidrug transport system ATPase subunit
MPPILSISALSKHYKSGLKALDAVDLSVERGEMFALLGVLMARERPPSSASSAEP